MKSWNQWSRQNFLVMVMDNKGRQETKMEIFPWWLVSPTHLKHMPQVKLDSISPKNRFPSLANKDISVAPSYWATKWLTFSTTRFTLLETNSSHQKTWNEFPKKEGTSSLPSKFTGAKTVSFRNRSTNVVATVTNFGTQFLSLSAMFSDQIRMTPTHPKHHMFHRQMCEVHSKSMLFPSKCGGIQ